jgi:hypothetical protein
MLLKAKFKEGISCTAKIAIISDIHSNIFALDAVLEDIATRNIE